MDFPAFGECLIKMRKRWEFPGGPVFRTQRFHCNGLYSVHGRGTEIPQAAWPKIKNEQNKKYI